MTFWRQHKQDAAIAVGRLLGLLLLPLIPRIGILMLIVVYSGRVLQRRQGISFSQVWFRGTMAEDSAHYAVFCAYNLLQPLSIITLLPVVLHSGLAITLFLKTALQETGQPAFIRYAVQFVAGKQQQILQLTCNFELASLASAIFRLITTMLSPSAALGFFAVAYFHLLRFNSKRNGMYRALWIQIGNALDAAVQHRYCPTFLRTVYRSVQARLAVLAVSTGR